MPSLATTPSGPLDPQYLTPLMVRKSYEQVLPPSITKLLTEMALAGTLLMVHASFEP